MELGLAGKVALVTGASRGIGRAIAAGFAEAGARVMLCARKEAELHEVEAEIAASGAEVSYFAANVGEEGAAEACVDATVSRFGSLDVLVNNAATNPYFGPMIEIEPAAVRKTLQVNLEATIAWARCGYEASMKAHGGCIVNVSSVGGLSVEPGIGFYNVTKAALIHATRQLAYELGPLVRVNALAPGLVKTRFSRTLWEGKEEKIAARLPMRRLGEPRDVAGAALFLASEAASWITGHVLVVDGGALALPSGGVAIVQGSPEA